MNSTNVCKEKQNNRQIGSLYEAQAKVYLEDKAYRIIAMNYRTRQGEIDMIATDREYTVFIEIKYRKH